MLNSVDLSIDRFPNRCHLDSIPRYELFDDLIDLIIIEHDQRL